MASSKRHGLDTAASSALFLATLVGLAIVLETSGRRRGRYWTFRAQDATRRTSGRQHSSRLAALPAAPLPNRFMSAVAKAPAPRLT
jgi:hypothetical protein